MTKNSIRKLLIANRGEIALRIGRTAAELGIETAFVYSAEDQESLHVLRAGESYELPNVGAAAYLDGEAVVQAALTAGADAIHPGYGFLSENAEFARMVEAAGLVFVGPAPETLSLLGNKVTAKERAVAAGVPVIRSTEGATEPEEALAFYQGLPDGASAVIKAVSGGGGRGMRVVSDPETFETDWERCRSEALNAFGDDRVYVEQYLPSVRHLEVQILGDGTGAAIDFGIRDCSLQRRHQKVVEIAPAPALGEYEQELLTSYALKLAKAEKYRSLGTFEFLMDVGAKSGDNLFFIEANPRLQVEHTVTEEVYGVDLVQLQLDVAKGNTLEELGLSEKNRPKPKGYSIQLRINMERINSEGEVLPAGGTIDVFEAPSGAGVRVDSFGYAGYRTSAHFDSLLAKLIVHSKHENFATALSKAKRSLKEFRVGGIETNLPWLEVLLSGSKLEVWDVTTGYIEQNSNALVKAVGELPSSDMFGDITKSKQERVLLADIPDGTEGVFAPMQSTIISLDVAEGDSVTKGQQVVILSAMKMENVIIAPCSGIVHTVFVKDGQTVMNGEPLLAVTYAEVSSDNSDNAETIDLDYIRDDLKALEERRAFGLDENRQEAVAKRHGRGHQTALENLSQVCDEGTFLEYGELAIAAQRPRRTVEDLIKNTSGDGIVTGLGCINGDLFGEEQARCSFAIYDYMVLAGTQGQRNHRKLDRIFSVTEKWNLPLVLFAEGGGGRPGDTERVTYAGISNGTFSKFARLSGKVPLVGVVSGRCFAGNAALLGCCDVIIADESTNVGMAGPAMIEGGGLGVYPPEAIGPIDVQSENGVVDIRVKDEAEACVAAKKYISYFQGAISDWSEKDQRYLRHMVPENRLRVYDVRQVIETLADDSSVLELRKDFGIGILTCLIRIGGKPFGLMANNPTHLGGAIDADAADKAARFMQLCDAFDLPIVSLCDTPGFMVGPEAEKTALVRHVSRMFVTAGSLSVPIFSVVLRKCYGLGAQAMLGGGTYDNFFTISWPTGEFGPMGLEGAVTLGYRRELDAIDDPEEKQALFDKLVAEYYEQGKATSVASTLEIDAVIDPVDTRNWILGGLRSVDLRPPLSGQKRPFIDTW